MQVDGAATNPRKISGHSGRVRSVAFSPEGRFLSSVDENGKVLVWCTEVSPFSYILNNSSVNFNLNLQKWQPIFQLETKSPIYRKDIRWNSAGTKLAIPIPSLGVNDDQCNRISLIQFHFFSSGLRHRS